MSNFRKFCICTGVGILYSTVIHDIFNNQTTKKIWDDNIDKIEKMFN